MRVLLLSAYAAQSHRHWSHMLKCMLPAWQWQTLELPPRHFSWRVRGNALYWSIEKRALLEADYDLLLATSMVDLATLRGLVPALAAIPTVLYFHENQFEYPRGERRHSLVDAQVTSIYSALAADRVLFNSAYNRDSFLSGCDALLGKLPDRVPPGVAEALNEKSAVLAVPIDTERTAVTEPFWPGRGEQQDARPLRLVWVGRFEHDKGGEKLLAVLQRLEAMGFDYELALAGQQFRQSPAEFDEIRDSFGHRLVQFGYLEDAAQYRGLLAAAHIVLSTANHEFQGLSILEAVSLGCLPAVPDRLAYAELYPRRFRYASFPEDREMEAQAAADLVVELAKALPANRAGAPDVAAFHWQALAPRYEQALLDCIVARDGQSH